MKRWLVVSALSLFFGCGSSSSGSPGHPDTGAGAGQTVPATQNCTDFCQRSASCTATLCDEDTHSTQYDSLVPTIVSECMLGCTDALLQSLTPTQWQCYFQSSCRQVLEHSACGGTSRYSC